MIEIPYSNAIRTLSISLNEEIARPSWMGKHVNPRTPAADTASEVHSLAVPLPKLGKHLTSHLNLTYYRARYPLPHSAYLRRQRTNGLLEHMSLLTIT